MMNCETVRDLLLTDYLDDELDPATRAAVDEHLKACPRCARDHDLIRSTLSIPVEDLQPVLPRRDLWPQIEKKIQAEQATSGKGHSETEAPAKGTQPKPSRSKRQACLLRLLIIALLAVSWSMYQRHTNRVTIPPASEHSHELELELIAAEDRSIEWFIFRAPQPETDAKVSLSDLQNQHVSAFRQIFKTARQARVTQFQTRRKEWNDRLATSPNDKEVIDSQRRDLHDLADSNLKARLQEIHRIRDLLTPEQRATLLTLFQPMTR